MLEFSEIIESTEGIQMVSNKTIESSVCINDKMINREDCQHCVIRKRMLFSEVEFEKLSHWLWPIKKTQCEAKTILYTQGQSRQGIFSLRQGFVKLSQYNEDGSEHIVRLLGPGACIGLEALLQNNYEHQAQAITDVDFCIIPIKTVALIEQEQPQIYKGLLEQWQSQLHQADEWLAKLLAGPIKQRLGHLLLMLDSLQKLPDNKIFLLSNQDLSSIVASTEESVSRCISDFRKKGLISRIEKRYYKLDLESIQKILQ